MPPFISIGTANLHPSEPQPPDAAIFSHHSKQSAQNNRLKTIGSKQSAAAPIINFLFLPADGKSG